ncbi:MAG: hypothetical protein LBJ98_03330 [Endomicrobium sp.]|nr:hypothetical protein [Endomicrobium sp.]MDR2645217.1 hypothetical protein [Endomicrobium sp.]
MDQSVIANWIAGRSDIGIDYIVKLSKIFNKTEKLLIDLATGAWNALDKTNITVDLEPTKYANEKGRSNMQMIVW